MTRDEYERAVERRRRERSRPVTRPIREILERAERQLEARERREAEHRRERPHRSYREMSESQEPPKSSTSHSASERNGAPWGSSTP